jgi:hypothetical protein
VSVEHEAAVLAVEELLLVKLALILQAFRLVLRAGTEVTVVEADRAEKIGVCHVFSCVSGE